MFSHGHGSHYHENEIHTALAVFEKAMLLSPELTESVKKNATIPFYQLGDHTVYLDGGFWDLTRAWIRIYIEELKKYCPCDLNPDLMIEEAKDYIPQGFFHQKIVKLKPWVHDISGLGVHLTAQYGYIAAILKLSAEVAETILSFTVGGKGIHVLCNAIDIMIFPFVRSIQKYARVFSHGKTLNESSFLLPMRMAWFSRKIKKSQSRVFFHIQEALAFRQVELDKINSSGPKSVFHRRGHRLLWIESLKRKTDPLFEEIKNLESELNSENISLKRKNKIIQRIEKLKAKIQQVSRLNRKDFFGMRFKRYFLLRSRKGRKAYMQGNGLANRVAGRHILWPLSFQENILEKVLTEKSIETSLEVDVDVDEIRDGLIEEFLSQKNIDKNSSGFEEHKKAVQSFITDIEIIFDVTKPYAVRLMKVYAIETTINGLFYHYFKITSSILAGKYQMSFSDKMKFQWAFGKFFNLSYRFSDFLAAIAMTKKTQIAQTYKYESMEKLFAFLHYLYEVQTLLKDQTGITKEEFFERLKMKDHQLRSISLDQKKTIFGTLPFKSKSITCRKLVGKSQ